MQNKYFRSGLVLASTVAVALLSGCASNPPVDLLKHDFTDTLSQPRPKTLEDSVATKKMYSEFSSYPKPILGLLLDTAIWEDEQGQHKGGFDLVEVYESTRGLAYLYEKRKHIRSLVEKHGTVPRVIRDRLIFEDYREPYTTEQPELYYGPVSDNTRTNLEHAGVMLVLAAFSGEKQYLDERERMKDFTYAVLSYRVTKEDEKHLNTKEMLPIKTQENVQALTDFYIDKIFSIVVDATKELGYKVAGNKSKCPEEPRYAKIFLAIEGNNCPKPNTVQPWNGGCYIGLGVGKWRNGTSWQVLLGEEGKTASAVIDWRYSPVIFNPNLTYEMNLEIHQKLREIILRKNPNVTFYLPAEEVKGEWLPQRVVDRTGTYYFVVPVKRGVDGSEEISKVLVYKNLPLL